MTEWLLIAAGLLIAFFVFKLVKQTISLVFTVAVVIGIALLVLGFFAIQDAQDFKENFGDSKSVFIQADNDTYLSAIVLDLNSSKTEIGFDTFPDKSRIPELLEEDDIPEEYYKLFIVRRSAFENASLGNLSLGVGNLNKSETIRAMYSEDPTQVIIDILSEKEGVPAEYVGDELEDAFGSNEDIRRFLFATSLMKIFGDNPLELIDAVKDENILIHPEPLMFKTIKLIPFGAFETADDVLGENETEEKR